MRSEKNGRITVLHFTRKLLAGLTFSFAIAVLASPLVAQNERGNSQAYLDQLEWRGVMALPGEVRISLHDKGGNGGFWIGVGEIRSGVEVVEYDAEQNLVTLRHGEATRTLTMSTATVVALEERPAAPEAPEAETQPAAPPEPEFDEDTEERLSELWQQASEGSFDLQEIDQAARSISREISQIEEAMAEVSENDSEYEQLEERHRELLEQENRLQEGALAQIRARPGLSDEERRELAAGLRAGFLTHRTDPQEEGTAVEEESQNEP